MLGSFGKEMLDAVHGAACPTSRFETGRDQTVYRQPGLNVLGGSRCGEACRVERQCNADGGVQRVQADQDKKRDFGDTRYQDAGLGLFLGVAPWRHDSCGEAQCSLGVESSPFICKLFGVSAEGRNIGGDFEVA